MKDKNMFVGDIDKDNIIGSAIIDSESNIIIADEAVYLFIGASHSTPFINYLPETQKKEFKANLEKCSYTPNIFISKCKHYSGDYVDISIVMNYKNIGDKKYINITIYDIKYMVREYRNYNISEKAFEKMTGISDNIFFKYNVSSGEIQFFNGKNIRFQGSMDFFRHLIPEVGILPVEYNHRFDQFCDAVEDANGDGFFKLMSNIFDEKKEFRNIYINFSTVEYNSQVEYVAGVVSSDIYSTETDISLNRADLDPLTGLLNKKAIREYAEKALKKAEKDHTNVTFVMIDLDNFKNINDTYGHMFGDTTLVNVARIMNASVGERGVVGRVGGDEFFIVLTGFEDGDFAIRPVLRSIRTHVEWYFKHKISDIKVTCSVGTSTYPADSLTYDDLYHLADHCLYVAKALGRNRFIIYTRSILGEPETILSNNTVINLKDYTSEGEKREQLLSVISRFNAIKGKSSDIAPLEAAVNEVLRYYGIDSFIYCSAAPAGKHIRIPQSDETEENKMFMSLYMKYRERADVNGIIAMGDCRNSLSIMPDLAKYLLDRNIFSALMIPNTSDDSTVNGIFIFCTRSRYKVWSDFDKKMLLVFCRLSEKFL